MQVSPTERAAKLFRIHGARAVQMLIDRTVAAVKAGDEAGLHEIGETRKAIDRLIEERNRATG